MSDGRPPSSGRLTIALGLALAPALTAVALAVLPRVSVGDVAGALVAFSGGVTLAVLPVAIAARGALGVTATGVIAALAAAALATVAATHASSAAAVVVVNTAIVALGHAASTLIGRRVQHPGHLLPACVVAALADLVSVLHPSGPTHAIVASERALAVLAIAFPVAGTGAVAPAIGIGDVLFLGLVLGVVAAHGLPLARAAALGALGFAVAGLGSALLKMPVPALVPAAIALVAGLPAARRLRPEDRRTALVAIAIAVTAAAALLARAWLLSS